jgi:P27 family predicted phage terminase small subunit
MATKKKIDIPFILFLNKYGKIEYERLFVEEIQKVDLTPAQQNTFIIYCAEYGNYVQLELEIQIEGLIIKAGNGTLIPNPKVAMKQACFKSLMMAATQLGLTPKSKLKSTGKAKMSMLDTLKSKAKSG